MMWGNILELCNDCYLSFHYENPVMVPYNFSHSESNRSCDNLFFDQLINVDWPEIVRDRNLHFDCAVFSNTLCMWFQILKKYAKINTLENERTKEWYIYQRMCSLITIFALAISSPSWSCDYFIKITWSVSNCWLARNGPWSWPSFRLHRIFNKFNIQFLSK